MKAHRIGIVTLCTLLVSSFIAGRLLAGEPKPVEKGTPLDALRAISGTWVAEEKGEGHMSGTCVFKTTAAGSAVIETMFPGQPHEMMNAYHMDGDKLMMTHYCAQGVQPRMKMVSNEGGLMKFELVDVSNLKSPDEGCMAGLSIKIDGDTMTEKWSYRKDGKIEENVVINLKRQG